MTLFMRFARKADRHDVRWIDHDPQFLRRLANQRKHWDAYLQFNRRGGRDASPDPRAPERD